MKLYVNHTGNTSNTVSSMINSIMDDFWTTKPWRRPYDTTPYQPVSPYQPTPIPFDQIWPLVTTTSSMVTVSRFSVKTENDVMTLSLDIPGIKGSDLSVEVENSQLEIKGENTKSGRKVDEKYFLTAEWDPKSVEAELEDGILMVTVQKRPESKSHKVAVKTK